jgi:hypothetical protein
VAVGKRECGPPNFNQVDLKTTQNAPPAQSQERFPPKPRIPSFSLSSKLHFSRRNLESELHIYICERVQMDALLIGGTLLGSMVGAFVIQKAALEGLLRVMKAERRPRH